MKNTLRILGRLLIGLSLACSSYAATSYNVFVPANGILKGATTTPVTTAAAWSDVSALLSGTCNSSVFVRGDGTCVAVSLTSNVSGTLPVANGGTNLTAASDDNVMVGNGTTWQSKALTDCDGASSAVTYDVTTNAWGCNSISTISGAALTKTDDTNVTLTLGGSPNTALVNAASITAGWTGTLAASRGGLGMATVTDDTVAVANGSAWQSKALTDCDAATSAVTYDTTTNAWGCNTINGATGANPTGTVGLSAVNGVATTFLRSDGAPALSQSITPTWTGLHTHTVAGEKIRLASDTNDFISWYNAAGSTRTGYVLMDATGGNGAIFNAEISIPMEFRTNNTARLTLAAAGAASFSSTVSATGAEAYKAIGSNTGSTNLAYLGFYESNGSTRKGYVGDSSSGNGDITLSADATGANIALQPGSGGQVSVPDGTAAAPGLGFSGDLTTGIRRAAAGRTAFSAAGVDVASIDATRFGLGVPLYAADGSAGGPGYSWLGDTNTGLYWMSADQFGFTTGGVRRGYFYNSGLVVEVPMRAADGTAGAPSITFDNSATTGLYRSASNIIGVSTAGTDRLLIGPGVQVGAPTGGDKGAGTVNATGVYINGVALTGGTTTTGTFTGTLTGYASGPTCAMKYRLVGSTVYLFSDVGSSCTGTSNATSLTMTGLPSAIQPTRATETSCIAVDSGAAAPAQCQIAAAGSTVTFFAAIANTTTGKITYGNNFANTGTKGIAAGWGMVYDLGN